MWRGAARAEPGIFRNRSPPPPPSPLQLVATSFFVSGGTAGGYDYAGFGALGSFGAFAPGRRPALRRSKVRGHALRLLGEFEQQGGVGAEQDQASGFAAVVQVEALGVGGGQAVGALQGGGQGGEHGAALRAHGRREHRGAGVEEGGEGVLDFSLVLFGEGRAALGRRGQAGIAIIML